MGFFILFLTITIKLSLAEIHDVHGPDDFLNYHRNEDKHHTEETDHKVGKIKYTEIVSLLHNNNVHKALLAEISDPSFLNDSKELRDIYNSSENVIVKEDIIENNQKFKRNTRLAIKDWNRLRRSNDNSDKETVKDTPKLTTGDSNKLEEDDKGPCNVTVKLDQDFKDTTGLITKYLNGLNKEDDTDKATVKDILKRTTGDSNKLEDDRVSGKVIVKLDQDFKDITGLPTKDLNGSNKEDNTDNAIVKDIPKLTTGDSNKQEGYDDKVSGKVIVKRDQNFKDTTGLLTKDSNGLNKEDNTDIAIVKDIPKLTTGDSNKQEGDDDKVSGKVIVKHDQDFKHTTGLLTKDLNRLNKENDTYKAIVKDIPKLTTGDSNKLVVDHDKVSSKVTVKRDQDFKDITGLLNENLSALNEEDNTNKAIAKDVPKLTTSDSNKLEKVDVKKSGDVTVKHDQYLDITKLTTKDLNGLNKGNNVDKPKVKSNVNNVRSKRHSALKLLRNLLPTHYTTTPTPRTKTTIPLYLRKIQNVTENSTFTDMIENLTKSIKVLNENLVNLKLHMNEKVEFVMIKVPIIEFEGKRFIKSIHKVEENNEYKPKNYNVRSKRDADAVSTDIINKNTTLEEHQTNFNITNNDNSIVDAKENVEPTIISDSEIVNKLNELNEKKTKRDANITNTEMNTISSNDIVNVTEKSNEIIKSRRSNIDKPTIKSEGNESNNSKTNSESKTSNTTINPLDIKVKEKTRKFLGNRDDLLFFIEKTHRDIKTLITPVAGIKQKYSATILYKIGYIIANLDTMELTLKKLKNRIIKNSSDTKKLHQVLKKLSMSKKLVRNVMEHLNKYAENVLLTEQ